MLEKNIIKSMRMLILKSYSIINDFPANEPCTYKQLYSWLERAERWNEEVQSVSNLIAYLTPSEVEKLHDAKHFHTPVYIALSEKANIIFAAWFQIQSKLYDAEGREKRREALS